MPWFFAAFQRIFPYTDTPPGLVPVHDMPRQDKRFLYVVMERVKGGELFEAW